ncbi:MAG: hypothetical protein ACYC6N_25560 [Pirellulaceae bacterium]
MPLPSFKLRLGSQQHLLLSGKRYVSSYLPDTYNCRISLRCGPLQVSGTGDFAAEDLRYFVNSVVNVISCLYGECVLAPAKKGSFSIHIRVGNTGKIVTDVKVTTLTSDSLDAVGWNTHARFQTPWDEYYNPIEVDCLGVHRLRGMRGHKPSIDG